MSFKKRLILLTASATLAGCAAQTATPPAMESTAQAQIEYRPGEFNEESLFDLLTAEIAGQRRDFDTAQRLIEKQAELNQNQALAERATRLAQFLRDSQRVESSAALWSELSPGDEAPVQILINILLIEGRADEALDLIEADEELSTETIIVIDGHIAKLNDTQAERLIDILEQREPIANQRLDQVLLNARTLLHLERVDEALALLNAGLRIESTQADLVIEKAQILANRQDKREEALKLVERALRDNSTNRQLRALQIQQLLKLDPSRIEQTVNLAIKQADNDPQLRYYYALLLMENDQPDLSEALFMGLIEADPEAADLYLYVGIIESTRGNSEAALDAFSRVLSGDSLLNATSRALEILKQPPDPERAEALIEESIAKDPERTDDFQVLFGQWLNQTVSAESGIRYMTEQIEKEPDNARLYYTRAMIFDAVDPLAMLEDLETANQIEPGSSTIENALGYTLLEYTEQYDRAYQLISSALEQSPDEAAVLDSMGWALHKLGRNDESLPYLEQAYELFPDPEVGSHLIIVLVELGERERAQSLYDDLVASNPDNQDLAEALKSIEAAQK